LRQLGVFTTKASLKTTMLYLALKVEVTKQEVVTLFPMSKGVSTSGSVCWETRKHGLELELGKVTSLSTITSLETPGRFS
ncbi:hypothetical protein, partial [Limnospira platensis]|uniref:hypothetical protein n=2 Tax=Limnospira platensis TaxID=118562 RepID=UPI001260DA58